jgi:hypothetical protein
MTEADKTTTGFCHVTYSSTHGIAGTRIWCTINTRDPSRYPRSCKGNNISQRSPTHQLISVPQLVFASRILLSLILGTSKLSALLLIRRLLPQNHIRLYICNIGILLVILWGIMAILTTNTNCTPSHMLLASKQNSCKNLDIRIAVSMALSCATEVGVLSLAVAFLGSMQVEEKERKWVVVAFLLRVP